MNSNDSDPPQPSEDDKEPFLKRLRVLFPFGRSPDTTEALEQEIESEMREQINHNLSSGIIRMTEDGHFEYSKRGLFFLWLQFLKDMARFC